VAGVAGAVTGAGGAAFDFGACWAWPGPIDPPTRTATQIADFMRVFTETSSGRNTASDVPASRQSQVA
jgi:hypothetical protein